MKIASRREHPHGVLVEVSIDGDPTDRDIARLCAAEQELLSNKRGFRRASWVAGRLAAAAALEYAGAPRVAVTSNARGAPVFPPGWTGSISHKTHIAVALVAPDDGWRVGVDVEDVSPIRERIRRKILTAAEHARIESRPDRWPAVLATFSIKESIYKALDPFVRRYVAFTEVELSPLPGDLTARRAPFAVGVEMKLTNEEGPFEAQTSCMWGPNPISTAKVRRGH